MSTTTPRRAERAHDTLAVPHTVWKGRLDWRQLLDWLRDDGWSARKRPSA